MRTLLSILAIGIEVVMILTLVGLSRGMIEEAGRRAKGVGADIWVRPPGSSALSMSSGGMDERIIGYFAGLPGVAVATGSLVHGSGSGLETVQGIDLEQFEKMSGGFRFRSGGRFQGADDIIVDERYAAHHKLRVGSPVSVMNHAWRVSGIVEPGKLTRLFLPLKRVQELSGNTDRISQIFLKLHDPTRVDQFVEELKANPKLANYGILSIEDMVSRWSADNIGGLKPFIGVVTFIAVTVGLIVVSITMYTAVLERTREIGILKSLGAQPGYIMAILMRESLVLGLVGAMLGIVFSYGTRWLMMRFADPMLVQHIVPDWWPWTTLLAVGGAVAGTLYPALKAVRHDTLEALSYD